jgi:hypothetical protein
MRLETEVGATECAKWIVLMPSVLSTDAPNVVDSLTPDSP